MTLRAAAATLNARRHKIVLWRSPETGAVPAWYWGGKLCDCRVPYPTVA